MADYATPWATYESDDSKQWCLAIFPNLSTCVDDDPKLIEQLRDIVYTQRGISTPDEFALDHYVIDKIHYYVTDTTPKYIVCPIVPLNWSSSDPAAYAFLLQNESTGVIEKAIFIKKSEIASHSDAVQTAFELIFSASSRVPSAPSVRVPNDEILNQIVTATALMESDIRLTSNARALYQREQVQRKKANALRDTANELQRRLIMLRQQASDAERNADAAEAEVRKARGDLLKYVSWTDAIYPDITFNPENLKQTRQERVDDYAVKWRLPPTLDIGTTIATRPKYLQRGRGMLVRSTRQHH